jgi:hypothetical protein
VSNGKTRNLDGVCCKECSKELQKTSERDRLGYLTSHKMEDMSWNYMKALYNSQFILKLNNMTKIA